MLCMDEWTMLWHRLNTNESWQTNDRFVSCVRFSVPVYQLHYYDYFIIIIRSGQTMGRIRIVFAPVGKVHSPPRPRNDIVEYVCLCIAWCHNPVSQFHQILCNKRNALASHQYYLVSETVFFFIKQIFAEGFVTPWMRHHWHCMPNRRLAIWKTRHSWT